MDASQIAVLIPTYNEANTVISIVEHCLYYSPNVIAVDDGSTDVTALLLKATDALVLENEKNSGKGASLLKGFKTVVDKNFLGVVTLDADGQHDQNDLARFFTRIVKNPHALIIGARKQGKQKAPKNRWMANKIADFFISIAAKQWLPDTQSGFRYYPTSFLKTELAHFPVFNRFAFESQILIQAARAGFMIDSITIPVCYPKNARASYYRPGRDTWEITKAVTKAILLGR